MSSNNEQERTKSGVGNDNNSTSHRGSGASANNIIPLSFRKRKSMDRSGGVKKPASKPTGGISSAAAPSKGRGSGGGKPSRGDNEDVDPKDPVVDKNFFDGGCE